MVRPRKTSFPRHDCLKGLLPYIRAVFAVGASHHDGYSRLMSISRQRLAHIRDINCRRRFTVTKCVFHAMADTIPG